MEALTPGPARDGKIACVILREQGVVVAVARDGRHRFGKPTTTAIRLVPGLGVEGDAHAGATVQHRSRVRRDPTEPNLRQVHLIHAELHDELVASGFEVEPGQMGENVTTRGLDLLSLPRGTRLHLGGCILEVTGLRNPCSQLDDFRPGLMKAVLDRDERGRLVRKAGVMAVVVEGGEVRPGDPIDVELPAGHHLPLQPV
jgi:MOSC domain-containing protein YiiM